MTDKPLKRTDQQWLDLIQECRAMVWWTKTGAYKTMFPSAAPITIFDPFGKNCEIPAKIKSHEPCETQEVVCLSIQQEPPAVPSLRFLRNLYHHIQSCSADCLKALYHDKTGFVLFYAAGFRTFPMAQKHIWGQASHLSGVPLAYGRTVPWSAKGAPAFQQEMSSVLRQKKTDSVLSWLRHPVRDHSLSACPRRTMDYPG